MKKFIVSGDMLRPARVAFDAESVEDLIRKLRTEGLGDANIFYNGFDVLDTETGMDGFLWSEDEDAIEEISSVFVVYGVLESINTGDPMFWSDEIGWTYLDNATLYQHIQPVLPYGWRLLQAEAEDLVQSWDKGGITRNWKKEVLNVHD